MSEKEGAALPVTQLSHGGRIHSSGAAASCSGQSRYRDTSS